MAGKWVSGGCGGRGSATQIDDIEEKGSANELTLFSGVCFALIGFNILDQ